MAIQLKDGYTPEISTTQNSDGTFTVSRKYILTNDDYSDGMELRILNYSFLPQLGDSYSFDYLGLVVIGKSAEPLNDGDDGDYIEWGVTVSYGTSEDDEGVTDPTLLPASVSFSSVQYEKTVDSAYLDGDTKGEPSQAILNTAFDPYDPPITDFSSNTSVTISFNIRTFNPDWIATYENTLNKSNTSIAGLRIGPNQARMIRIGAQNQFDTFGNEYWTVTYEIEVSSSGFKKRIVSIGFNQLKD